MFAGNAIVWLCNMLSTGCNKTVVFTYSVMSDSAPGNDTGALMRVTVVCFLAIVY